MASHYLNTDLDLACRSDLTPLATAFAANAELLHCGLSNDQWHATVEAADSGAEGRTPQQDIESLLAAIDALPTEAAELFEACETKEMNIGWQAAEGRPEGRFSLPPETLDDLAARGIALVVTVYPSSENDRETR